MVKYAGQKLTTGKQAECYANDFIGLHLKSTAGGATYADLGAPQSKLRTQVADAQKNNDTNLASMQQQLADVTAQRDWVSPRNVEASLMREAGDGRGETAV